MMATDTEIMHFLSIYSHKNLTKAALALNTTQPALTQSLARLENKLGTSLFIRTKQGCSPTAAGNILYQKASQLQEYWSEIAESIHESTNELKGKFRLGCHPSMGAYILPDLFKVLNQNAPKIELELVHDFSRNLTEKVIQLELDLALVVNPERHPDLIIQKLGIDRSCFWKSSSAREIPKILFTDTKTFKGKIKQLSDYRIVETSSLELIRTLVNQGAGFGFIPERVAKIETNLKLMTEFPTYNEDICLIYREGTMKTKAALSLLTTAKMVLK